MKLSISLQQFDPSILKELLTWNISTQNLYVELLHFKSENLSRLYMLACKNIRIDISLKQFDPTIFEEFISCLTWKKNVPVRWRLGGGVHQKQSLIDIWIHDFYTYGIVSISSCVCLPPCIKISWIDDTKNYEIWYSSNISDHSILSKVVGDIINTLSFLHEIHINLLNVKILKNLKKDRTLQWKHTT